MGITNYDWDDLEDNIDEECDSTWSIVVEYTTTPQQFGQLISQFSGGQRRYYQFDGIGSTTELTTTAGTISDTRRYSAFGEVTETSGNTSFPYEFIGRSGYYRDTESALLSVRRRMLSVTNARWLSPDILSLSSASTAASQLNNLYWYAENNPLLFVDPSGEAVQRCCGTCWAVDVREDFTYVLKQKGNCPVNLPADKQQEWEKKIATKCLQEHKLNRTKIRSIACKELCICMEDKHEDASEFYQGECLIDVRWAFIGAILRVFFPPFENPELDPNGPIRGPCEVEVRWKLTDTITSVKGKCR